MQAFIPKTRRPKFELVLRIIDLNNVPLVSGTSLVKWHLPHSSAAEHRGRSNKCHIKEHKVTYDYEKTLTVKLTVDKSGTLEESSMYFEVLQEYSSGARGERIILGSVKLNLAEYVDASELDGEVGVCRRYLMQDSKINSTLKIGIKMTQVEGDRNFVAPPLKSAPVFGGIAGIMAGETGASDEADQLPNLTSKSRETGETQDMYRRNLAAYWTAQAGELRADDCIEDIFAGGDGWAAGSRTSAKEDPAFRTGFPDRRDMTEERRSSNFGLGSGSGRRDEEEELSHISSSGSGKMGNNLAVPSHHSHRHFQNPFSSRRTHAAAASSSSFLHPTHHGRSDEDFFHKSTMSMNGQQSTPPRPQSHLGKSGSIEQHANEMKAEAAKNRYKAVNEVDEFALREDLRSWNVVDGAH